MLTKHVYEIKGYGGAFVDSLPEKKTITKVIIQSDTPVIISIIVNGYEELITDLPITGNMSIDIRKELETKTFRVIAKTPQYLSSSQKVIMNFDLC